MNNFVTSKFYGRTGNLMFIIAAQIGYAKKYDTDWFIPRNYHHREIYKQWPKLPVFKGDPRKLKVYDRTLSDATWVYEEIPFHSGGLEIRGFFQSEKFFKHAEQEVKNVFKLPIEPIDYCSIHVRRGDYLDKNQQTFCPIDMNYIRQAMQIMKEKGKTRFMVVSDDLPWCRENIKDSDCEIRFSDGKSVFSDLTLMASCQPIGTKVKTSNGDVNIESIKVGDKVISYCARRYGQAIIGRSGKRDRGFSSGRTVTDIKQRYFQGQLIRVDTITKSSRYTPDHHCIVSLGNAFKGKYILYLMGRGDQFRVGITGPQKHNNGRKINVTGFSDVRNRMNAQGGDRCWILKTFDNLYDVRLEEMFVSSHFGIPQTMFLDRNDDYQDNLNNFWERVGNNSHAANKCLQAHGRLINEPFVNKQRKSLHEDSVIITKACNLIDGMKMLDYDHYLLNKNGKGKSPDSWMEIKVSYSEYEGPIFSLKVDKNETYFGDGLLTHNCTDHIISNSTLAWWGAWLGHNESKVVVSPHHEAPNWFLHNRMDTTHLIPKEWIEIKYR